MDFKKRSGTSGIGGQFFETKLLSLFVFRLQHDDRVEDFYLASNMDEIGYLDDICLQIKLKGRKRPLVLFMQLKHKDSDDAYLTFDNKTKTKYIDSYIKIKNKISFQKDNKTFFDGNISEADCLFILYTNAEIKFTNSVSEFASSDATLLHEWLATSDSIGCQLRDAEEHFEENVLLLLAQHFVKFLNDKGNGSMNIMNDKYVQRYHVILQQKVLDVSDVYTDEDKPDSRWRTATFRDVFFDTYDENITLFRNYLIKEVLKEHPNIRNSHGVIHNSSQESSVATEKLISCFLSIPSAATLTPLIMTHISCNEDGKLKFLVKRSLKDKKQLELIKIAPKTIEEAVLGATADAIKYLRSLQLKVPISFGNVDLAIRCKRLDHLATSIVNLLKEYEQTDTYKIVTIDDHIDGRLLKYSGCLACIIGNILIYDDKTDMLQFSNDVTSLPKNAKNLLEKLKTNLELKNAINNLHEYRFNIKTDKFPKLRFDCVNTTRGFLDNFVIYGKQSNHSKVENILKEMIKQRLGAEPQHSFMNSHSVFLHYHEEILKWWMTPHVEKYLTKANNLFEQAINDIRAEPRISDLHTTFYMNNLCYFRHKFSEQAIENMKLPQVLSKIFITTDTVTLTTVKVIQSLKYHYFMDKYALLDLECVFNLSRAHFDALVAELRVTDKVVIVVYRSTQSQNEANVLRALAQATREKQLVFITNNQLTDRVKEYFACTSDVFNDETETLLSMKSYKQIMKEVKVQFQNRKVSLDVILDDESVAFIKGVVLDKIICNESLNIGTSLSNARYDEIEHLYIDRKVTSITKADIISNDDEDTSDDDDILVKSFHDIKDDVVLLTAPPGMGKSTLLTHLSLNTTEQHMRSFIVRVNFIDHSRQFYKWHDEGTVVDTLESLKFLCQVISRNKAISFTIAIINNEARLETCAGDQMVTFELNIFLHFYNKRRLIFVFDGFDEICPSYKDEVLDFLTITKTNLRKYKMWVTSRPYSDILVGLQKLLGSGFRLKYINLVEQEIYLNKFWREKLVFEEFNDKLQKNIQTFIDSTIKSIRKQDEWIRNTYYIFYNFVSPYLTPLQNYSRETYLLKADYDRSLQDHYCAKDTLTRIPLLLYFMAHYFMNIVHLDNLSSSYLDISTQNVYKLFIENKIKMRFQDKRKVDLYDPDIIKDYKEKLDNSLKTYKKLAAYALLQESVIRDFEEFSDVQPLEKEELNVQLTNIKTGADKTDLISHVTYNDIPVFIHRSFTEYFATEYICDILKSDKLSIPLKTLLYCIIADYSGVRQWLYRNKDVDTTLQHIFNDIENSEPIYCSTYRSLFNGYNMSKSQYIRILASYVNDYEAGSFDKFGNRFLMNYLNRVDRYAKQQLIEYLKSYFICKMKSHLRVHFVGPTVFRSWYNNIFVKDFDIVKITAKVKELYDIVLKVKILGQKRSAPLYMRLEDQDTRFEALNIRTKIEDIDSANVHKENIDETDFVYILCNNKDLDVSLNSYHESRRVSKLNSLLSTTSAVSGRLHYSEQNVKDFAEIILEKDLSLLAKDLGSCCEATHTSIHIMDRDYVQRYHVILRQKVVNVTEIQTGERDLMWRYMTFRDEFFENSDKYIVLFRNYLLEETLRRVGPNSLHHLHPDELISSFLSNPSVATLTPLIGTQIVCNVCCTDGKLQFRIARPFSDVEQLRQVNMPQSTINETMLALKTAVIAYLRELQLKVPVAFGNVDLTIRGTPENIENRLDHMVNRIVKLCADSEPHKVVFIDSSTQCTLLADAIGNVLISDEETDMLKFSNLHTMTKAQKNAKSLLHRLSYKIKNLHEYRFQLTSKYAPKLRFDCTNTAREFLSKVVIYAEQGQHYAVKEISNCIHKRVNNFS